MPREPTLEAQTRKMRLNSRSTEKDGDRDKDVNAVGATSGIEKSKARKQKEKKTSSTIIVLNSNIAPLTFRGTISAPLHPGATRSRCSQRRAATLLVNGLEPAERGARSSGRSGLTFVGRVSPGPGAGDETYYPDGGEIRPSQVCSHVCRGETCVSAVGTAR